MATSRNMTLVVLAIAIGLALFYMIDPTMGGLIGSRRYEGFYSEMPTKNDTMVPAATPGAFKPMETGAQDATETAKHGTAGMNGGAATAPSVPEGVQHEKKKTTEGFMDLSPSPMPFPDAEKPANCYPKNQLSPQELLPNDPNSKWAQVNPMAAGDISGKNFLNAGSLIGVNTVGQSLRNANQQLRSEPPCPQVQVSIWNQSTIEPDLQRRPLEGF
jgi:hypothetical protein